MRAFFVTLCILVIAPTAFAQEYFSFNPDYSRSILVATSDALSEVFLPLNDYLGGYDFWLSNQSTPGDATFTIGTLSGETIDSQLISLPAIADNETGSRIHISLPAQIRVSPQTPYRITIQSAAPTLRIYFSDATQLLAHNGSPTAMYAGGRARIGDEDMGFSFKFSLHESTERTPPILSGVSVEQLSPSEARLSWYANEPVDHNLIYNDKALTWSSEYSSCVSPGQPCSVYFDIQTATTYSYTLTIRDVWGNTSSFSGVFISAGEASSSIAPSPSPTATSTPVATSTPAPDVQPPIISKARLVTATASSATFAWTTNEAATSSVVTHILPFIITAGWNTDTTLELEHFVTVSGLPADTFFRATISSRDAANNDTTHYLQFTTPSGVSVASSTPTPNATHTPSPLIVEPVITGAPNAPQLRWAPPLNGEPSDGYRIDIFDANNNLVRTISVASGSHTAALGISPSSTQRIVVYENNNGVYQKTGAPTILKGAATSKRTSLSYVGPALILLGIFVGAWLRVRRRAAHAPTPLPPTTKVESR